MNNRKVTAILLAVLLFVSGAVIGILADRYVLQVRHQRPTADTMRQHYVDEMKGRLHLSDDQITRLNTILDETHAKFKAFRESHRPEVERINQEQTNNVRAILTAQQLPEYNKLLAEHEKQRKQHER